MKTQQIFYTKELVFDIKGRAYAKARSTTLKSDNPDRDDAWLMDVASDEWSDTMVREIAGRLMRLAFYECAAILSTLTAEVVEDGNIGSDTFKVTEKYTLKLSADKDVKEVLIKYLNSLIHEFIVYLVLFKWCELVAPEHAEIFKAEVDDLKAKIKSLVGQLGNVGYRKYFPF